MYAKTIEDILDTFCFSLRSEDDNVCPFDKKESRMSIYICGSAYEGTSLDGMESDIDCVLVSEDFPVVTDVLEAKNHPQCFLIVQDIDTPAGYVKFQQVIDGEPKFPSVQRVLTRSRIPPGSLLHIDKSNRVVFTITWNDLVTGTVVNGPARTIQAINTKPDKDCVPALRCRQWPMFANEWLTRPRRHNWPSKDLIRHFRSLGCLFVCVGCPGSTERHLQWRVSFSLQERHLVSHFNSVQLMCYILVKIIKNEIIYPAVGEASITSYQCKTSLFFIIENTPSEFWSADNLLYCLKACMTWLLQCIKSGNCPNYFIPESNMLEGRFHRRKLAQVKCALEWVISSDFKYLPYLKTQKIGIKITKLFFNDPRESSFASQISFHCNKILYNCARSLLRIRNAMLENVLQSCTDFTEMPKCLLSLCRKIRFISKVNEHSQKDTIKALSLIAPFIEISLSSLSATLVAYLDDERLMYKTLISVQWYQMSLYTDAFSSRLKQASLLHVQGHHRLSLYILSTLEERLNRMKHPFSVCGCFSDDFPDCGELWGKLSALETVSVEDFLHDNLIPCVIYLPQENDMTPSPLCNENLTLDEGATWYDGAAVDGKILLYLLMYLNHHCLGMNADTDANNLKILIETDYCLGHRETALNILGWIYNGQGHVDKAAECFQKSLTIQPSCNAAVGHLQNIPRLRRKHALCIA